MFGIISSVNKKISKNNTPFAFFTLEDETGSCECIAFSKVYEKYKQQLFEGSVISLNAGVSYNDDDTVTLLADSVEPVTLTDAKSSEAVSAAGAVKEPEPVKTGNCRLYLRFTDSASPQIKVCSNLISIFDGKTPVYYFYENTREYVKMFSCDANEVLLRELKKILGSDNAVLK